MASALNKLTLEYRQSVNTPDYPESEWWINPDITAVTGVGKQYWIVANNTAREMTTQEKDSNLAQWKLDQRKALVDAVNAYGEAHYDQRTELRLKHEYNRAVTEGLTNRAAHIKTALDWSAALITDWMTRAATTNAATTHDGVFAVSLDFSNNDATDPSVTVTSALQVIN